MKVTDKITITNEDNMNLMSRYPDKYFDLAIDDPPYGICESSKKRKNFRVLQSNGNILNVKENIYSKKNWDSQAPSKEYFFNLIRKSKNQIIFGANYFEYEMLGFKKMKSPRRNEYDKFLSDRPYGYIIWDKVNGTNDFSDCEIIYTSRPIKSHVIYYMWSGMMQGIYCGEDFGKASIQQGNKKLNDRRIHPTQKPVPVLKYLLNLLSKPGYKILDPHSGSASLAVACHDYGFELTASELDPEYYKNSLKRIQAHVSQLKLF